MYLHKAMRKYGFDNFICEVIEECHSLDNLYSREKYWIGYYDSTNNKTGYNISLGGDGATLVGGKNGMFGRKHTEETKEKIREAKIGLKLSDETKALLSSQRKGVPKSEKHKASMSKSRSGENHHLYGKSHKDETKMKMSESRRGSSNSNAKLSDEDVVEIIKLLNTKKYTQKEIGDMFRVSRVAISAIKLNKSWKHIKRD